MRSLNSPGAASILAAMQPRRSVLTACGLVASAAVAFAADNDRITLLEKRTAERPHDFVALTLLGQEWTRRAREVGDLSIYTKAEAAFRAALAEFDQHPPALIGLGAVRMALHRFDEAAQLMQKVLASHPDNDDAHLLLFDALFATGNVAAAEKQLAELEESPAILARRSELARFHGATDDERKLALRAAEGAEGRGESAENVATYRVRLGELYFRRGDFDSAEAQYRLAQTALPTAYSVSEHIAELRGAQEHFGEASGIYQKLLSRADRPDLAQALGDLYDFQGSAAEAKPWHQQALAGYRASIDRGEIHFIHHLAGYYCDVQQDGAEAVKWARKDLEMRQTPAAHDAMAWALYRAGDFLASRAEIDAALSGGIKDAHILSHASFIYSAAGDLKKGEDLRREAAAVNPHYNNFHVHR